MRAKKARTEMRQEQIARAAMKLLALRGWQRISLAAIAREVGVVTSAVYRHFKSKDEVLDAVLDLVEQRFQANVGDSSNDPLARLHDVLMRHVDLITSGVPVPRIILSEAVFAGHPRHRKRVQKIYQNYLVEIAVIFRDGQEQGLIQGKPSPETLSIMWLGLVQSPAILWLLGHGKFDLTQHCQRAWQLFAAAIRADNSNVPSHK
ncbi:MAG: TetR/AcrR family transcriptional regulator [Verrucomicrobiota bacterium]